MNSTTQAQPDLGFARPLGRRSWAEGLRPSGMVWLVWRQHRTAFTLLLATAAVATAGLAWLARNASSAVAGVQGPRPSPGATAALETAYGRLGPAGLALAALPMVIGVFVGAPLFAEDLETGTAKLVSVQSAPRWKWITTKLGMAAVFAVAAALSTGIAMRALWTPLVNHNTVDADFTSAGGFDTTGPVAVSLALLGLMVGAAAGLLMRRVLPAALVTLVALVAVKVLWGAARMTFAPTVTKTTGHGRFGEGDDPHVPVNAVRIDTSYVTGNGTLRGWGTCVHETDASACLRRNGVVGWREEYLPFSHMDTMQWTATGALAGLILLTAGVLAYAARRALD